MKKGKSAPINSSFFIVGILFCNILEISHIQTFGILNALKPYLENQFKITGSQNSFVFLNSEGRHFFDSKNIRDGLWKKVLEKANENFD